MAFTGFRAMFEEHCRNVGISRYDLKSMGSRRHLGITQAKEPDESYKPSNRTSVTDKPSFVVEVGLSETMNELRTDAHFGLSQTNGKTRLVLLIHIKRNEKNSPA